MKKFSLSIMFLCLGVFAFAQPVYDEEDDFGAEGTTLEQPAQPLAPLESRWKKENIGEFSDDIAYKPQRESDVFYQCYVWRTIDLREKMNHPLYFPTESDRAGIMRSLANVILDAIDEENPANPKALAIYDDQNCNVLKSQENLKAAMVQTSTRENIDPETGEVLPDVLTIEEKMEGRHIMSYMLKEVWYFDARHSEMRQEILCIAPMIERERPTTNSSYDVNNEFEEEVVAAPKQKMVLGWIRYDQLRPYLAKQEAFNVKNNAQRMSYDDMITWKRQFSSYITGQENVYNNRGTSEYITNPRDQMIRADEISNKIRSLESDLWEM
ncbi:MAG: gliding motility protein GldN [Bacteroidales bacterium]|jgi:gliding motility associated protien GldN|nr:gliding motility protein GldN [Bacteroidales bacterium]